jgi:hypothetical protein
MLAGFSGFNFRSCLAECCMQHARRVQRNVQGFGCLNCLLETYHLLSSMAACVSSARIVLEKACQKRFERWATRLHGFQEFICMSIHPTVI